MFFVRTASVRDVDKVQQLLIETWHDTYDEFHGHEKIDEICQTWHSAQSVKQNIEKRDAEYIVADDGQKIGGMAFAIAPDEDGIAQLSQLYVSTKEQGQGVGTDLLNEIIECFPLAKKLRVEVDALNINAAEFYKKHGFSEVGEISDCGNTGFNIRAILLDRSFN